MNPHPPVRQRGTALCRACGERGHFTVTCEKYAGKRFGRWTVLRGAMCPPGRAMSTYVLAECDCGVQKTVAIQHLKEERSTSCGCSRTALATQGDGIPIPEVVMVYGAPMSLGELASLAGRKVEYVCARMRMGKSAEEAAFGKAMVGPQATRPTTASRADLDSHRALVELKRWTVRWDRLRDHPRLRAIFAAMPTDAKPEVA